MRPLSSRLNLAAGSIAAGQPKNAGHITLDAQPAPETIDNYTETVKFLQVDMNLEEAVEESIEESLSVVTEEEKDNIISFLKNRKDKMH